VHTNVIDFTTYRRTSTLDILFTYNFSCYVKLVAFFLSVISTRLLLHLVVSFYFIYQLKI